MVAAWVLLACDEPPSPEGPIGLGPTTDASLAPESSPASGALPDGGAASPERAGPTYAAVSSDWTATSIAILGPRGELIADDYIHTGSARAGLSTALSGDVALPSRSGESGVLVLLDRFRTDVLTRVRLADGAVLGQLKTQTPSTQATQSSYSSNPHDYVLVDERTAWVVRNEPNLDPSAPELERGNDLLRIDPSTMQRAGERIDLSALDVVVAGEPGAQPVILYARPSRIARLGKLAVVGVGRSAFDYKQIGAGAVALVDLEAKSVRAVELEGLKGCTNVVPVPNDADSVLVGCYGDSAGDERATAGLVLLGVADGAARIEHVYRAKDDPSPLPFTSYAVSLGGTLAAAAASDFSGKASDGYALVDLATGKRTEIASASPGSARFGTAAFDAESGLLLLPDASLDENQKPTAGVRRFQQNADKSFSELPPTRVSASTGMPVRHVYAL